ncbi:MAG: hypothetical protein QNK29_02640 [Desulfobacterales bacterium]|nr:hypothetical protein [Desulfobacterales bacterium]MDX2510907.1 hypothetical protein [Desulfobacterales bacterium]
MQNSDKEQSVKASQEQIIYANLLIIGVWVGIAVLVTTYAIYLTGLLPSHVDMSLIPKIWGKSVTEYLEITHSPHGWGWVALLAKGDFINYIGLALLALMTIFCFMVLLKGYIREKNWIFSVIAFLEITVLSIAASGILGSGGH